MKLFIYLFQIYTRKFSRMASNPVKLIDRFRGAMLGGLIGDCLGANFEFVHGENLVPKQDIDNFFKNEVDKGSIGWLRFNLQW